MSKFLAIEQALKSCGEGQFEKIIGQVLQARGVRGVSLLGSVIGKHKTRAGVPDAFATTDGDKFSLVAATTTTELTALVSKLRNDVDDCSNPTRTGIPIERIERVYIAFNSVLPATEIVALAEYSRVRRVEPEFMSISDIAGDLTRNFPWIARDEFGISIDTGQILSIDAFVDRYDRGALATPLSTKFCFREDAMAEASESLSSSDLIISGPSGAGKTRLALELARRSEQGGTVVRCILTKGLPLYEDLARHFSEARDYLVIIDDANRVSGVEHLLQEALSPTTGRSIRFILTARDYAREECAKALKKLGRRIKIVTLAPFNRDETDKYVSEIFAIVNPDYQRQIWQLSRGNARLATMAARQAIATNRLEAIRNVTELYDSYYGDLIQHLDDASPLLLRALGIVATFRILRADNFALIETIEDQFGLHAGVIWEMIDRLHGLECVDLHDKRIAKCSDQVLAGFAFYLCFISRKNLSFSTLISAFGSTHLNQIRDAVYGAMSTMDRDRVVAEIRPACVNAMQQGDLDLRLRFMESFWFVEPDLVLTCVIQSLAESIEQPGPFIFAEKASLQDDVRLQVLSRYSDDPNRAIAAAKSAIGFSMLVPSNAGSVLSLLVSANGFGVGRHSHLHEYQTQREITKILIEFAESDVGINPLLAKYLKASLATEFEAHFSEDNRVHFMFIPLQKCAGLNEWRSAMWCALRSILQQEESRSLGKDVLKHYAAGHARHSPDTDVLAMDAPFVSEIFHELLHPDSFEDCLLARSLSARFRHSGLNAFAGVFDEFRCAETDVLDAACLRTELLRNLEYQELVEARRQRVIDKFGALSTEDLASIFALWAQVAEGAPNDSHDLSMGWEILLDHIGREYPDRLAELTNKHLENNAKPDFIGSRWISFVLSNCGRDVAWKLLSSKQFEQRREWLITFYLGLRPEQIIAEDAMALASQLAPAGVRIPWLHSLRPFIDVEPNFLRNLIGSLMEQRGEMAGEACRDLLGHIDDGDARLLLEQFAGHVPLLMDAYLKANEGSVQGHYFDHSATLFNVLLDLEPTFAARYVARRLEDDRWLSRWSEDYRDYSRLWSRSDWNLRFHEILKVLASSKEVSGLTYVAAWLPGSVGHSDRTLTPPAHSKLLCFIEAHATDVDCMEALFSGLVEIAENQRFEAIESFLKVNLSADAFSRLSFLPSHYGGSGSMVPVLQRRVDFLHRIMGLLVGPSFIGHRVHLNMEISNAVQSVDWMVEREFADHD